MSTHCREPSRYGMPRVACSSNLPRDCRSLSTRRKQLYASGLLGRPGQSRKTAAQQSHDAACADRLRCCAMQHARPRQSVSSSTAPDTLREQLRRQANNLAPNPQQPSQTPTSVDGRRTESIVERTAAHGDMSEADVRSNLQVRYVRLPPLAGSGTVPRTVVMQQLPSCIHGHGCHMTGSAGAATGLGCQDTAAGPAAPREAAGRCAGSRQSSGQAADPVPRS